MCLKFKKLVMHLISFREAPPHRNGLNLMDNIRFDRAVINQKGKGKAINKQKFLSWKHENIY